VVALRAGDVERFLARPDPNRPVILVYGPDAGLVRERVDRLLHSESGSDNPFALVTIDGDTLAADPARLADEARTIGLFGDQRRVHVRAGARSFADALAGLLADPPNNTRVVIEAGDLRKGSPLRQQMESSPAAAVLPCYADDERAILALIERTLKDAGLSIDTDAREALVRLLGADRLATRSELEKLVVYAQGQARISFDDIQAVTADAAALALDETLDAAAAGEEEAALSALARTRGAGIPANAVLIAAIRHVANLHRLALRVERGEPARELVQRKDAGIHFRRQPRFARALARFNPAALEQRMTALAAAAISARRTTALADALVEQELLKLARSPRAVARS
jgi:DNA polymerase-3 subunit delta